MIGPTAQGGNRLHQLAPIKSPIEEPPTGPHWHIRKEALVCPAAFETKPPKNTIIAQPIRQDAAGRANYGDDKAEFALHALTDILFSSSDVMRLLNAARLTCAIKCVALA